MSRTVRLVNKCHEKVKVYFCSVYLFSTFCDHMTVVSEKKGMINPNGIFKSGNNTLYYKDLNNQGYGIPGSDMDARVGQ